MENKMTWTNCFSSKRFGIETKPTTQRTEYERDWDRIIFSSPFRRLQNKTQVFPLPEEIFVHNRLTHSLEVASVGRSLGKIIGKHLSSLHYINVCNEARNFYKNNLKNVIASACLAHDLGNPAFGHSGEEAISKYFKSKSNDNKFKSRFSKAEWKDLTNFEGNANALRILTMQRNGKPNGSLRLTYSTLGAIIKYPCESLASVSDDSHKHLKKYGFFKIDEDVFINIANELNMISHCEEGLVRYKRHPFVYLVEAADDICYNIIDMEDAHRLGIIEYNTVKDLFLSLIKINSEENMKNIYKQIKELEIDKNEAVAYLRAKTINTLTIKCAETFIKNMDYILNGTYNNTLIEDIPEAQDSLNKINRISKKHIYNFKGVVKLELAGFRIMSSLVEDFVTAALIPENEKEKEHKKILELLPYQFNFKEDESDYNKVIHILDFISGMTDLFALKLYRNLRGIEI